MAKSRIPKRVCFLDREIAGGVGPREAWEISVVGLLPCSIRRGKLYANQIPVLPEGQPA